MVAGLPKLRSVSIDGPYNVFGLSEGPSRQRLFVCHPASVSEPRPPVSGINLDDTNCATKILHKSRASRLPASGHLRGRRSADVVLQTGAAGTGRPEAGSKARRQFRRWDSRWCRARSFEPVLSVSIEKDPAGAPPGVAHPVSDVELASRLSFFLWSSIPDEKLLDLAVAGAAAASAWSAHRASAPHA